jgi:hypothetical protein
MFFQDLLEYNDPLNNEQIKIGNTIDFFNRPSNGDIDDWVLYSKKILSMSLYLAPY